MLTCAVTDFSGGQNRRAVSPVLAVPPMPVEEDEMGEQCTVRRGLPNFEQLLDRRSRSAFLLRVKLHDVKGRRPRGITFLVRPCLCCTGWCTSLLRETLYADLPNSPRFLDFGH